MQNSELFGQRNLKMIGIRSRLFLLMCVLCFPALGFGQEKSTTYKIAGRILSVESAKLYQIQVGSFKNMQNAEKAYTALCNASLNPVYDTYRGFTRVKAVGICARDMADCINKIRLLGFREIWIREDDTVLLVSTVYSTPQQYIILNDTPIVCVLK